jgi:hypothetical protein
VAFEVVLWILKAISNSGVLADSHLWSAVVGASRRVHFHIQFTCTSTFIKSTQKYTNNSSAELTMYKSWLAIPLRSVGSTPMVLP